MTTPRTAAAGNPLAEVLERIAANERRIATAALESRIEPVADLIHEACVAEWERRASRHPGRALTLHGPDAHVGAARVVLGLETGT